MDRDPKTGRFVKGNSGKPKGARTRAELTKAFLTDAVNAWETYGRAALERIAEENPVQFAKVLATLVPRDDSMLIQHQGKVDVNRVDIQFIDTDDTQVIDSTTRDTKH